jgi:C4-dicarboxylate-binding protein DctP
MRIRSLIWGLCLSAASLLAAPAWAADPIVIKFSHVTTSDTPKGKAAEKFKELAEARTEGRVKVEVYPNSTLYKDREEVDALQMGSVQMLAPSLAKFGPMGVQEFEVFDLPFLFDDYNDVHKVTEGPVGRQLMSKLEPKGIIGLAFWDNGFKDMTANRSLREPADFRGLRMRIQSSRVLDAQFRALGATPQVIPFSEVYQAMLTGAVDGSENTPSNIYTQRMHEVQRYLTTSNHGYLGYAVIVNKRFWQGLPADIRVILEGAMHDATVYANGLAAQENDEALEMIRKAGTTQIVTLTPEQRASWKKALGKVHRDQEDRIGKDLIQAVYQATGKPM